MAWSDNDGRKPDPWGDKGAGNQSPPDLDDAFRKIKGQFTNMFSGGGGGDSGSGSKSGKKPFRLSPMVFVIAFLILAGVYGAFGFYQVDQQEQAVVLRLGQALENTRGPGLKWNPPIIDRWVIVNVTQINQIDQNSLMLTEDENLVVIDMEVQYRVEDAKMNVVEIRDPVQSLAHAAESALRHVVGSSTLNDVITTGRESLAIEVKARLDDRMEEYFTGINVSKVIVNSVGPPSAVQDAFDEVQRAKEDKARFENQAEAYRQQILPEARGLAAQEIEKANAYTGEIIAKATGEAERFLKLLSEFEAAPEVTQDRLYIQAVESVLQSTTKVMVDIESGNNLLFLPLDQLRGNASTNTSSSNLFPSGGSSSNDTTGSQTRSSN